MEFVEALTIVLAVGVVRGWRPALTGALAAAVTLAVLVGVFGQSLAHIDMPVFKMVVGTLLLLFGLRWLKKAILRAAGVLALHDEAKAFAKETAALKAGKTSTGFDFGGAATAFNGVFIEGVEVVFIVLAVGAAGKQLWPATFGSVAAAVLVLIVGLIARHPLTKVPENALKMVVGVLISAFGTFWVGEGLGLTWPGEDWVLLGLSLGYLIVAGLGVVLTRRIAAQTPALSQPPVKETV